MSVITRLLPDRFVLYLLIAVGLASLLPAQGLVLHGLGWATNIAIALLFFLHGARLSSQAIVAGVTHWRLHLTIFSTTFLVFPLLGLALRPVLEPLVGAQLYTGVLFLCCLPATVQSAIALTSIARGNLPAAVCSAASSSLLGIFITPLLVGLVIASSATAPISYDVIGKIMLQLLLPFVLGQFARRWIGAWVTRHKAILKFVDQGSIILVVYVAFSQAINEGLWSSTSLTAILGLVVCSLVVLLLILLWSVLVGKVMKFDKADQITALFCGSKKSLATGVPMAQVIFAGGGVGMVVLPLMIFHQIQLMLCSVLASRFARRTD
ncbi:MAG: bile acid:sodium symporter [Burkholderiaceae bacterium]|nr:bile acid:sodium symporter [Burkholderiaceae bacterium]